MEWKKERRKVTQLKNHPKNPRKLSKHDAEHLKRSIEKFGQCEPIVINDDNTIIGGHQRLKILKKCGYTEVDVYVPEHSLSDLEVEELNIRLNKNSGDFDWDILGNEWEPADLVEYGFTHEELQLEEIPFSEPGETQEKKRCILTATFKTEEDIQQAENLIAEIVSRFQGAFYKVKI